jgi:hypothetical protein
LSIDYRDFCQNGVFLAAKSLLLSSIKKPPGGSINGLDHTQSLPEVPSTFRVKSLQEVGF